MLTDGDPQNAGMVVKEARQFLSELDSWTERAPDTEKLTIYLFNSYDEFQRVMKAKGEGITYYGSSQPIIGLPLWPLEIAEYHRSDFVDSVIEAVGADWRRRLRHELVHVYFREADGLDRDWLWEGLADYLAHDGARGEGMKAQRFLTLKAAWREGRLHTLKQLRELSVNASRADAELLYAESWSAIYTIMNRCGPEARKQFQAWVKRGAPGEFEDILAQCQLTLAQVDHRRLEFISRFRCFLELSTIEIGDGAWLSGLRNGDQLLRIQHHAIGSIASKKDLGIFLSYLFQPPPSFNDLGRVRCVLKRDDQLASLQLPVFLLPKLRWRLTAEESSSSLEQAQRPTPLRMPRSFKSPGHSGKALQAKTPSAATVDALPARVTQKRQNKKKNVSDSK